jgi:hypothetical protein
MPLVAKSFSGAGALILVIAFSCGSSDTGSSDLPVLVTDVVLQDGLTLRGPGQSLIELRYVAEGQPGLVFGQVSAVKENFQWVASWQTDEGFLVAKKATVNVASLGGVGTTAITLSQNTPRALLKAAEAGSLTLQIEKDTVRGTFAVMPTDLSGSFRSKFGFICSVPPGMLGLPLDTPPRSRGDAAPGPAPSIPSTGGVPPLVRDEAFKTEFCRRFAAVRN